MIYADNIRQVEFRVGRDGDLTVLVSDGQRTFPVIQLPPAAARQTIYMTMASMVMYNWLDLYNIEADQFDDRDSEEALTTWMARANEELRVTLGDDEHDDFA